MVKRYGLPYMGSKNNIAEWIIDILPPADHFYDVFGGGGAISHCALLSGKYKHIHYNEFDPLAYEYFTKAIHGGFKNENRWISREEFNRLKDTDPYVAYCFSFGNNGTNYMYSNSNEKFKKALHYAIMFNDFSLLEQLNIHIDNNIKGRIPIIKAVKELLKLNHVELEKIERLQRIQNIECLQRILNMGIVLNIETSNNSYIDLHFEPNSVIYCDPPYANTGEYRIKDFNHEAFYSWAKEQENIFISGYMMPEDFICVAEKEKRSIFSQHYNSSVVEKLFTYFTHDRTKM